MKTIKFIGLVIVAAIVGFAAMCIAIAFDASDRTVICVYFMPAIVLAGMLGAFDVPAKKQKFNVIRRKKTTRKKAA